MLYYRIGDYRLMAFPVTIYRSPRAPAQPLPKCCKVIREERCPVSHYVSKNTYVSDAHDYEIRERTTFRQPAVLVNFHMTLQDAWTCRELSQFV